MSDRTSTLTHTEKILSPFVALVLCACVLAGIAMLHERPQPVLLALWLALTGSNAFFLAQHRRLSVGMVPPAIASLAPAAASALLGTSQTGAMRITCLVALVVSCSIIALFAFWFARLRMAYQREATVADDANIIVLGGAVVNGEPRPTLARRLNVAFELCAEHPQRTLVLTGGPLHNEPGTEAEAMERYLRRKGIPKQQMLMEQRARNTRENIAYSCNLLDQAGHTGQRCVLTSEYHLYRAVREGRMQGVELVPIAAPTPLSGRLQQWCREVLTILAGK